MFNLLYPDSIFPVKAHQGDAGHDLFAHSVEEIAPYTLRYGTGVSVQIPEGFVGLLVPRSSIYKKNLRLSNSVGVIDSGYTGEIFCVFDVRFPEQYFNASDILNYKIAEKIAQLVVVPFYNSLPDSGLSVRYEKGFGSSDFKIATPVLN